MQYPHIIDSLQVYKNGVLLNDKKIFERNGIAYCSWIVYKWENSNNEKSCRCSEYILSIDGYRLRIRSTKSRLNDLK